MPLKKETKSLVSVTYTYFLTPNYNSHYEYGRFFTFKKFPCAHHVKLQVTDQNIPKFNSYKISYLVFPNVTKYYFIKIIIQLFLMCISVKANIF